MADASDIERMIAGGELYAAVVALRLALLGHPERQDMANLLARVLAMSLRSRRSMDADESFFGRAVSAVGAGNLDVADRLFRAGFALDPADCACRVALAVIFLVVSNMDEGHLVLDEVGAVDVRRRGNLLRITPIGRPNRGRALFAYYSSVILLPAEHQALAGHTNRWESRCIARMLIGTGYIVDAIDLDAPLPPRIELYDVVFCLHDALARMADRLRPDARKIMLLTGSSPDYQNRRERERLAALAARTGKTCEPRRQVAHAERELEALALADHCLLHGNAHTRSTYAASLQAKTLLIPVTGGHDAGDAGPRPGPGPSRHILWLSGIGAIHKGLDLAVEVFLRNPGWTLEVVGTAADEPDFRAIYGESIRTAGNIRLHGFQFPSSREFREIAARCVAFLGTSCSEGMSSACVTGFQHGLVPILTRDCGLDIDESCGTMAEEDSIDGIERAIRRVMDLSADELARQGRLARVRANAEHSRHAFAAAVGEAFGRILPTRPDG